MGFDVDLDEIKAAEEANDAKFLSSCYRYHLEVCNGEHGGCELRRKLERATKALRAWMVYVEEQKRGAKWEKVQSALAEATAQTREAMTELAR